jgi:hypothetical protein
MRAIKIVRRYGNEREEGFRVIEGTIFAVDKPLSIGGKELRVIKASRAKTLVGSRREGFRGRPRRKALSHNGALSGPRPDKKTRRETANPEARHGKEEAG